MIPSPGDRVSWDSPLFGHVGPAKVLHVLGDTWKPEELAIVVEHPLLAGEAAGIPLGWIIEAPAGAKKGDDSWNLKC